MSDESADTRIERSAARSSATVPSGSITKLTIGAELARHGLMAHQLWPWENPDLERIVYPKSDPDTIEQAWHFIAWLEGQVFS